MEAYDLARKLAYAGNRSPVPFTTGPEYTNSVPGVPVLSMLRIFISPEHGSTENIMSVAREVARVLGPTEQFDVGITLAENEYNQNSPAQGVTARLIKLDPRSPDMVLRIKQGMADQAYSARYPRLNFEPLGKDFWRTLFAPGAAKPPSMP